MHRQYSEEERKPLLFTNYGYYWQQVTGGGLTDKFETLYTLHTFQHRA